jgi:perosamine synthetase
MLAQGQKTEEFESAFSKWLGVKENGIAVGSGSAAIVLALDALEVGDGDEVILPTYVCPKVMEAVITTGATPVLCDMSDYWLLKPENVEQVISRRTRALIVPHLYGIFTDIEPFHRFGIPIIEDCAQAIGDRGNRQFSPNDIAIFSFHPTKLITTGEGGMAVSSNAELVGRMRTLRDGTGSKKSARLFSPMSDMSAALGLSQLARYKSSLERRKEIAGSYRNALESVIPGGFGDYPLEYSMFFRFPIKLPGGIQKYRPLFEEKGIRVSNCVDELLHRLAKLPDDRFKMSVSLFDTTISLPIYPALTEDEKNRCVEAAVEIVSRHVGTGQRARVA